MFLASFFLTCLAVGGNPTAEWPAAHEVVRGQSGIVMTVTNTTVHYARMDLCFIVPDESEDEPYRVSLGDQRSHLKDPDFDVSRIAGPLSWGAFDGVVYNIAHNRSGYAHPEFPKLVYSTTNVTAGVKPLELILEREGYRRTGKWPPGRAKEIEAQIGGFIEAHGFICTPFTEYVTEHARSLYDDWDLTFDVVYTSVEDVFVAAVRQGRMMVWELHDTGVEGVPWTERPAFSTTMEGPFRILHAGPGLEHMFFLARTGAIYAGLGSDHRRIGEVAEFVNPGPQAMVLVFEDQKEEKIGLLKAEADGTITPLPIQWYDDQFASHFMQSIEDDALRQHLQTIASIHRDAEE